MKSPSHHRSDEDDDEEQNFKVVVRIRPPLDRELENDRYVSIVNTIQSKG